MADAIISLLVEQLLSIVKEQVGNEIQLVRGVEKELRNLSAELEKIRNKLEDADTKQFKDKNVKDWLWRLEQASYEMEDVLEEWSYTMLQHKIQSESESESESVAPPKQKVCSFFPSSCLCFKKVVERRDIAKKIQNLKTRLDDILKEEGKYDFVISQPKVNDPSPTSWRVQTTSLVDSAQVQGRSVDQDVIVSKLTATHEGLGYQVHSIVGAGGLGKTTLAQLVYNDPRVKECFDLRIWICVSDPFDVAFIAKGIVESINGRASHDATQLDALLKDVMDSISSKKILLVLDDVWNEQEVKWEPLKKAIKCVGASSKILVTTRKGKVARILGTVDENVHRPELLSHEECWMLMSLSALSGKKDSEIKHFEEIGKEIAKKCNGLPLAAKTLGSVLGCKNTIEGWENVLKSEMWKLEHAEVELFPHLLLSYQELSPALKHCFSYCAAFPKDEVIEVKSVIRIWMALGYLGSNIGSAKDNMELKGLEFFEDLAMRSLFQDFKRDDDTQQIVSFKMHDIVHDFAQFLRKNDRGQEAPGLSKRTCQVCDPLLVSHVQKYRSVFLEEGGSTIICDCLTSARVLINSLSGTNGFPRAIEKLIHLRYLQYTRWAKLSKEDLESFCKLYFLQTLRLNWCSLEEVPEKIGNLVQLKHLDLSSIKGLKKLPQSLCRLIELQTLLLAGCSLEEIPGEIGNLVQLKHLDLSWNKGLKKLPNSICCLIELQTLLLAGCSLEKIPGEIGNLVQLKHLDLRGNKGLKKLPNSICCLIELQTLLLAGCSLKEISGEIGNLVRLRHLDLRGNIELNELPNSICCLIELQILTLAYCSLEEIPEEIGNLVKLRHLNLSRNEELKKLPQSLCRLIELQTLLLASCSLEEIPGEIGNLVRLRHLDLSGNEELIELPESMCSLVELQILDIRGCGFGESGWKKLRLLKNLNRLRGDLGLHVKATSSSELEELASDAREAELRKKEDIKALSLEFEDADGMPSQSASLWVDVIEALEPHHNLKKLGIQGYKGFRLPQWISSPLNLVTFIHLRKCSKVESLPLLGKLPLLEELDVFELAELKVVGVEWLGIRGRGDIEYCSSSSPSPSSSAIVAFPKLRELTFYECGKWSEWEDITTEEEESTTLQIMPSLTELRIVNCGLLEKLPLRLMRKPHSLQELHLDGSLYLINCLKDRDDDLWRHMSRCHPHLHLQCHKNVMGIDI